MLLDIFTKFKYMLTVLILFKDKIKLFFLEFLTVIIFAKDLLNYTNTIAFLY